MDEEKQLNEEGRPGIKQLIGKHRNILLLLSLSLTAVVLVWVFYLSQDHKSAPPGEVLQGQQITVLPDEQREVAAASVNLQERLGRDPFAGPVQLKGIVRDHTGHDLVIMEAGGVVYITGRGRTIADTWTIVEITSDAVYLESDRETMKVGFGGFMNIGPRHDMVFNEEDRSEE